VKRLLTILLVIVIGMTVLFFLTSRPGERPPVDKHYKELSFDLLRSWTYVEGKSTIPAEILAYEGQPVEMLGYMVPLTQSKEITQFVLMPYLFGCCFGGKPAPNHMVLVQMVGGTSAQFVRKTIYARGTFHCGESRQDGQLISLYRLDAEKVIASR
jgi:hypothetical protein